MKRIILVLLALASISSIKAQTENEQVKVKQEESTEKEKKEEKKKKNKKKMGGLWKQVKKGVESGTGIDVSSETLFVYPEMGVWKMTLKSANANSETGEVKIIFSILPLDGQKYCSVKITSVIDGNGKAFKSLLWPSDPKINAWEQGSNSVRDLGASSSSDLTIRSIYVEKGMKSIKTIIFTVNSNDTGFEARDIPITWVK